MPPISWKIVSIIYACGCVLCALFAALDMVFKFEQVKGFWLIFGLFPLTLLYSLYKWRGQSAEQLTAAAGELKAADAKKKD